MSNVSLHQFLVLYTWFPLAALLFFFLLIARFYQKFSGIRTYYWLYLLAIILFGVMAVRHTAAGLVVGDVFTDIIGMAAGTVLLGLMAILVRHMLKPENKI